MLGKRETSLLIFVVIWPQLGGEFVVGRNQKYSYKPAPGQTFSQLFTEQKVHLAI